MILLAFQCFFSLYFLSLVMHQIHSFMAHTLIVNHSTSIKTELWRSFFFSLLFISYSNCYSGIAIWTLSMFMRQCAHFIRSNNNWSEEHSVYSVHLAFEWRIYYFCMVFVIRFLYQFRSSSIVTHCSLQSLTIECDTHSFDCTFKFNSRFIEINKFRQKKGQPRNRFCSKTLRKAILVNRRKK